MTLRRVIIGAAILHVALAMLLFVAGRAHLARSVVTRDGLMARIGHDSYGYQEIATEAAATLRRQGVRAWMHVDAPPHARALSILFAFFGDSVLAAEPFNLACYLAIIALVYALAREVASSREGVIAAAIVALWPTFLLHTLQMLKDPLFIAGALLIVLIVTTWLTRTFSWRDAAIAASLLLIVTAVVLVVRAQFLVLVAGLMALAVVLLIARQIAERRLLLPNIAGAATVLAILIIALAMPSRTYEKVKRFPALHAGESKSQVATLVPTEVQRIVVRRGVSGAIDRVALHAGAARSRFIYVDARAGSGIDDDVTLRTASDVIAYLPRAAEIGLWAPFPNTWMKAGRTVGASGKILASFETLAISILEIFALIAVLRPPRRLAAFLLLTLAVAGVTAEAVIVTNIGALYRFRYSFWMLFIVLGVAGFAKLRGRARAAIALLVLASSCARPLPQDAIRIANITGFHIRALYLSPHDAPTWQDNVLGSDSIADGEAMILHMPPVRTSWDLRVDGGRGYRAQWSNLDLTGVSSVTLHVERGAVVADLETQH